MARYRAETAVRATGEWMCVGFLPLSCAVPVSGYSYLFVREVCVGEGITASRLAMAPRRGASGRRGEMGVALGAARAGRSAPRSWLLSAASCRETAQSCQAAGAGEAGGGVVRWCGGVMWVLVEGG